MRRDCWRYKQDEQASEMSSDVHDATCRDFVPMYPSLGKVRRPVVTELSAFRQYFPMRETSKLSVTYLCRASIDSVLQFFESVPGVPSLEGLV
jgi:hypothetical protein